MQISGVSLALTWPRRLCLLRVLLCVSHCYKLSPFQAYWGGDTAPAFSGLCVYSQFMWEVGLPPSPVEFSSHCHFYKLSCSDCWAVLLLLLASMFVYRSPGKWVFPPLLWSFPPSATLTRFPAPGHALLLLPCLARPSFFIYSSVRDSPPPLFSAQGAPPFLLHVFIVLIAYYSVSLFFSLGGGQSIQGAMLIWPELSVGVPQYR
jgi:hypothetical protein